MLVGNVEDGEVCNSLVRKFHEDYGYYKIASAILNEGGVHVDVGANYGFYTFGLFDLPFSKTVRYVLIEPNPDCVQCHELTKQLYPGYNITSLQYALTDSPGTVWLSYDPSCSCCGHLGKDDSGQLCKISAPSETLDNILDRQNIKSVDLLKMDIEGSEVAALRGAKEYLCQSLIRSIYIEVNYTCLLRQGANMQKLFDILISHDYHLFWPHASVDWILMQYNNPTISPDNINIFEYQANVPLVLAEFNADFFGPLKSQQFDLLAFPGSIAAGFKKIKSAKT
jgi:FkbM family methyltransferase